ncbi:MAG: hypothetical protein JWO13_2436 [Acidobacteriales bacterium]|nr:hypothetical protein [Terriglobales bacterium]
MSRKFMALGALLSFIAIFAVAQEKQQTPTPAAAQTPAKQNSRASNTVSISGAEVIGLKNDVKQMRVILHQMQNNMGAATSAQDPLKHHMELEIEMWQVVIDQMDRRIKAAGGE